MAVLIACFIAYQLTRQSLKRCFASFFIIRLK